MESKLNIVIPHRGSRMGLWMTLCSCEEELRGTNIDYDIAIVENGQEKDKYLEEMVGVLDKSKRLLIHTYSSEPLAPPAARTLGASYGNGDIICFLDNHCIVGHDFFKRAVLDIPKWNMDSLHGAVQFNPGGPLSYHYRLTLDKNFWGRESLIPEDSVRPYKIASAGHGAFFVTRKVWAEVSGYWDGFRGYGAEESYFDLKLALLGKSIWLDPKMHHYHYPADRGYPRHFTDDYWRNCFMSANIIGGRSWMERVVANALHGTRTNSTRNLYEVMQDAYETSQPHAEWLAARRQRTLDEALGDFVRYQIAH